uniref:FLYWCH-type domain-containing protein n=1 Tax=Ditylenchus dipsaci TaxID=166011 RepID=A0A915DKX4_9BILA
MCFQDVISMVKSEKGNDMATHRGFRFIKHQKSGDGTKQYWKCDKTMVKATTASQPRTPICSNPVAPSLSKSAVRKQVRRVRIKHQIPVVEARRVEDVDIPAAMLYALLKNKSRTTYLKLFRMIRNLWPDFRPTSFSVDFELAAIQALQETFPVVFLLDESSSVKLSSDILFGRILFGSILFRCVILFVRVLSGRILYGGIIFSGNLLDGFFCLYSLGCSKKNQRVKALERQESSHLNLVVCLKVVGGLFESIYKPEEEDSCSTTSPPELSSSCNPPAPSYPPLISAPLEETEKMCAEVSSASFLLDSGTSSPRLPDYFVPIQEQPLEPAFVGPRPMGSPSIAIFPTSGYPGSQRIAGTKQQQNVLGKAGHLNEKEDAEEHQLADEHNDQESVSTKQSSCNSTPFVLVNCLNGSSAGRSAKKTTNSSHC